MTGIYMMHDLHLQVGANWTHCRQLFSPWAAPEARCQNCTHQISHWAWRSEHILDQCSQLFPWHRLRHESSLMGCSWQCQSPTGELQSSHREVCWRTWHLGGWFGDCSHGEDKLGLGQHQLLSSNVCPNRASLSLMDLVQIIDID